MLRATSRHCLDTNGVDVMSALRAMLPLLTPFSPDVIRRILLFTMPLLRFAALPVAGCRRYDAAAGAVNIAECQDRFFRFITEQNDEKNNIDTEMANRISARDTTILQAERVEMPVSNNIIDRPTSDTMTYEWRCCCRFDTRSAATLPIVASVILLMLMMLRRRHSAD